MEPIDLTIIVPIYNAERYLKECLESILRQTYQGWKCIMVDDGSSDGSPNIIDYFCSIDHRFSCLKKQNEGSAALARRYALERCSSEWVLCVDADDAIAPDFIEKLVQRQKETGADSVSGRLVYCDEQLNEILVNGGRDVCPLTSFDMTQILSGREACLLTIGGWQIGGAGITKRNILTTKVASQYCYINSDELYQRVCLLNMKLKAFADVDYYYRGHSGVSQKVSVRQFERTLVDMQLEDFVKINFPEREDKIIKMAWQRLFNLIYLTADFEIHKNDWNCTDRKKIETILERSYHALNRREAWKAAPWHTLILTHSFSLFRYLSTFYVKYKRAHGGKYIYQ